MGGRPSSGTKKDKRLSKNNPGATRDRPMGAGKGRKSPGSGRTKGS